MIYWISWLQPTIDYRPLAFPPNDDILGYWCTESTSNVFTLYAYVVAGDEEGARAKILKDWPEAKDWRICEPQDIVVDSDHFPLNDWTIARCQMKNIPTSLDRQISP